VQEPVLATGAPAVDTLEVTVDDASPAPWRTGTTVVARGTLYGPLPVAPIETAAPPHGAPVAWTELVELDGPGTFTSSGDFAPTAAGHYTWVWSIEAAEQPEDSLLPEDYSWSDRYGIPAESFEVVQPLPSTGAEADASPWLIGVGVILLGGGLVGATAVLRVTVRRGAPTWSRAALPRRRRAAAR
jgi:hypothetical protein